MKGKGDLLMRRKVYTKRTYFEGRVWLINKEGFGNFTARNIAKQMGISTQPIYLEFENMQDLKNTLVEAVFKDLSENVFPVERTGDKVIDLGLNYIHFAQEKHNLYIALFVDDYGGGKLMHDFSSDYFKKLIKSNQSMRIYRKKRYSLAQWCLDRCYRHCFIDVSWNHYANGGTNH